MSTPVSDSALRVPDEIGSMYGWRTWAVNRKALRLEPMAIRNSSSWFENIAHAKCVIHKSHTAPHEGCMCGLYGAKQPSGAMNVGHYPRGILPSRAGLVLGRVRLWGRLIEYEDGYRAEHAQVISLVDDGTRLTRRVAAQYNVDLIPSPPTKKNHVILWILGCLVWMLILGGAWFSFLTSLPEISHIGHVFFAILVGIMLGFFTLCSYALGGILRVRFLFPKRRR